MCVFCGRVWVCCVFSLFSLERVQGLGSREDTSVPWGKKKKETDEGSTGEALASGSWDLGWDFVGQGSSHAAARALREQGRQCYPPGVEQRRLGIVSRGFEMSTLPKLPAWDFFPSPQRQRGTANCARSRQQLYPGQRERTRATNRICSAAARKRE